MAKFLGIALGVMVIILGLNTPVIPQGINNPQIVELEQLAHEQVNQYRISQGLAPLQLDDRVSQQARIHSQNMAEGVVPFSHDGFEDRIVEIAAQIPYSKAAENVAYNQGYSDPAQQAVKGWIDSPGHQQNMVASFDLTGMGVAKNDQDEYYFTQIFILKR